jgi:hypothetical protein
VDEKELLRTQIKSYEFYAGLIERAVGGGASARLPRWDEQRAIEYRQLADQLRQRLAELEAREQAAASGGAADGATTPASQSASASGNDGQAASTSITGGTAPASSRS